MIGFAMRRGLENGWLENEAAYRATVDRAWDAIYGCSERGGTFIDVC